MKPASVGVIVFGLVLSGQAYSASDKEAGKTVFDKTCAQCHGPEGKGDLSADKFYQVRIPRLNSEYVQGKSDQELKEIITKGKKKMTPVRPGQPTAEHKLKAEWVDDVIAYVRTLKKG
ncbi:MAG: cytochrome c [Bryobacteraceae bacterium]|nr:cytochrome c [Bryobacteraceae bacterium]